MTSAHHHHGWHGHHNRYSLRRLGAAVLSIAALGGITGVAGAPAAQAAPWDAQVAQVKAEAARHAAAPLNDLERMVGAHPAIDQARGALGIAKPAPAPAVAVVQPLAAPAPAPVPKPAPAPTSVNQRAVDAAISRTGAPYAYGAAGPSSFDCSGLVQWSYAQAGKSIPRTSQAQIAGGRPVSLNQLQPGDIVGYYSGASHVAMYVGNGMVIHASTYGTPVKQVPLYSMPVVAAVRY